MLRRWRPSRKHGYGRCGQELYLVLLAVACVLFLELASSLSKADRRYRLQRSGASHVSLGTTQLAADPLAEIGTWTQDVNDADIVLAESGRRLASDCDSEHARHHSKAFEPVIFFMLAYISSAIAQQIMMLCPESFRVPHSVNLFLIGYMLGAFGESTTDSEFGQTIRDFKNADPHIIFWVLLPAILYEDSSHVNWHVMQKVLPSCCLLAIPGVILNALLTGCLIKGIFTTIDWSWDSAFLLGSILSATDPVAVMAALHELGAPDKLALLVSGESLINDGSAVVIFSLFWESARGLRDLTPGYSISFFLRMALGGPALGFVVAILSFQWLKKTKVFSIEILVLLVGVFGSFFVSEHPSVKVSGVLAVVVFGFFMAAHGHFAINIAEEARHHAIISFLGLLSNEAIFVLAGVVGYRFFNDSSLSGVDYLECLLLFVIIHFTRAFVILLCGPLMNRCGPGLKWKEAVICVFGGLRGAVGLAMALLVEADKRLDAETRTRIAFHTSGIVLGTLLINGTTITTLYRRLQIYAEAAHHHKLLIAALKKADIITRRRAVTFEQHWFFHNMHFGDLWTLVPNLAGAIENMDKTRKQEKAKRSTAKRTKNKEYMAKRRNAMTHAWQDAKSEASDRDAEVSGKDRVHNVFTNIAFKLGRSGLSSLEDAHLMEKIRFRRKKGKYCPNVFLQKAAFDDPEDAHDEIIHLALKLSKDEFFREKEQEHSRKVMWNALLEVARTETEAKKRDTIQHNGGLPATYVSSVGTEEKRANIQHNGSFPAGMGAQSTYVSSAGEPVPNAVLESSVGTEDKKATIQHNDSVPKGRDAQSTCVSSAGEVSPNAVLQTTFEESTQTKLEEKHDEDCVLQDVSDDSSWTPSPKPAILSSPPMPTGEPTPLSKPQCSLRKAHPKHDGDSLAPAPLVYSSERSNRSGRRPLRPRTDTDPTSSMPLTDSDVLSQWQWRSEITALSAKKDINSSNATPSFSKRRRRASLQLKLLRSEIQQSKVKSAIDKRISAAVDNRFSALGDNRSSAISDQQRFSGFTEPTRFSGVSSNPQRFSGVSDFPIDDSVPLMGHVKTLPTMSAQPRLNNCDYRQSYAVDLVLHGHQALLEEQIALHKKDSRLTKQKEALDMKTVQTSRARAIARWQYAKDRVLWALKKIETAQKERQRVWNQIEREKKEGWSPMQENIIHDAASMVEIFQTVLNSTRSAYHRMYEAHSLSEYGYQVLLFSLELQEEAINGELRISPVMPGEEVCDERLRGLEFGSHEEQMSLCFAVAWQFISRTFAKRDGFFTRLKDEFMAKCFSQGDYFYMKRNVEIVLAFVMTIDMLVEDLEMLDSFEMEVKRPMMHIAEKAKATALFKLFESDPAVFCIIEHVLCATLVVAGQRHLLTDLAEEGLLSEHDCSMVISTVVDPVAENLLEYTPTRDHLALAMGAHRNHLKMRRGSLLTEVMNFTKPLMRHSMMRSRGSTASFRSAEMPSLPESKPATSPPFASPTSYRDSKYEVGSIALDLSGSYGEAIKKGCLLIGTPASTNPLRRVCDEHLEAPPSASTSPSIRESSARHGESPFVSESGLRSAW